MVPADVVASVSWPVGRVCGEALIEGDTMMGGSGMASFGMGGWWLLVVGGVVLLVVLLVRLLVAGRSGEPGGHAPARSAARRLLDERYARGELASEEYHERVRILGEGG